MPRAADSEGSEEEQKNRKHKSKSLDLYEVRTAAVSGRGLRAVVPSTYSMVCWG